jgi:septal ring factor EnvC (AmiA/AmiB activator)
MSRPARLLGVTLLAITVGPQIRPTHGPWAQQASPEHRAAARRANERLRTLREEAQALLARERTLLVELRRLEVERSLKLEEIRQFEAESARVNEELVETTRQLTLLQRARAEQAPALRARLREVYKLGAAGYLRVLVGVDHPRDLGRALRTVSAMAALDQERARAHKTTVGSLVAAQKALVARRAELQTLQDNARTARAELGRAVRARADLVASIDERRDLNAQLTGELQAAQAQLQQTLAGLGGATGATLPLRTLQGALEWPVNGRVLARFGQSRSARTGTSVSRRGIDIAANAGDPVRAVHDGTIVYAAPFTGFGNLIILDHGNRAFSLYGYLDRLDIARGDRVAPGNVVGSVGLATGGQPALYFELRVDGQPVDPLQWLKGTAF